MRQQKKAQVWKLLVLSGLGFFSTFGLSQNAAIAQISQANRARQSEAKQYLGSMTRGQQAFYLENSKFTNQPSDLGIRLPASNANYSYSIQLVGDRQVQLFATSKRPTLRSQTPPAKLVA